MKNVVEKSAKFDSIFYIDNNPTNILIDSEASIDF